MQIFYKEINSFFINSYFNECLKLKFFPVGSCDSLLSRIKRQQAATSEPKKEESFEIEICKDKDAGEWFRLTAQDGDSCRDVIQCTSSVSIGIRIIIII